MQDPFSHTITIFLSSSLHTCIYWFGSASTNDAIEESESGHLFQWARKHQVE